MVVAVDDRRPEMLVGFGATPAEGYWRTTSSETAGPRRLLERLQAIWHRVDATADCPRPTSTASE